MSYLITYPDEAMDENEDDEVINDDLDQHHGGRFYFFMRLVRSFINLPLLILLLAACVRQTAGFTWAYNTRTYFQTYYPKFNLGLWVFACSIIGGSFGVFFGGFASDRLVF